MIFQEMFEDINIKDENTLEFEGKEFKLSQNIYLYSTAKDFYPVIKQVVSELRDEDDYPIDLEKASYTLKNNIFHKLSHPNYTPDAGNVGVFQVDPYGNLYLSYYDCGVQCSIREYTGFFKYITKQQALKHLSHIAYVWDCEGLEDSKIEALYNIIMRGLDKLDTPEAMLKYSRPLIEKSSFYNIDFENNFTRMLISSTGLDKTPDICFDIEGVSKAEELLNFRVIDQLKFIVGSNFLQQALNSGLFKVIFKNNCKRLYICTKDATKIQDFGCIRNDDDFKLHLLKTLFKGLNAQPIAKLDLFSRGRGTV